MADTFFARRTVKIAKPLGMKGPMFAEADVKIPKPFGYDKARDVVRGVGKVVKKSIGKRVSKSR